MSDGFPKDMVRTGRVFADVELATSNIVPNCRSCFVMSGQHVKTKENGFYAFCKKTGELESFGPYRSIYEAVRALTLARNCDECERNQDRDKENMLQELDQEIQDEIISQFGEDHILNKINGPLLEFFQYRMYIDVSMKNLVGERFFKAMPEDSVASLDLAKPCKSRTDFSNKIQILAGLLDRMEPNI